MVLNLGCTWNHLGRVNPFWCWGPPSRDSSSWIGLGWGTSMGACNSFPAEVNVQPVLRTTVLASLSLLLRESEQPTMGFKQWSNRIRISWKNDTTFKSYPLHIILLCKQRERVALTTSFVNIWVILTHFNKDSNSSRIYKINEVIQ